MKRPSLRSLLLMAPFLWASPAVHADEISDNFQSVLATPQAQNALDELAFDMGALVGGGSFHTGKSLGFPLGIDVGVHAVKMDVSSTDPFLRDNGSSAEAMTAQAEFGLPGRLNLIARGGKIFDGESLGGGLRWGIFKSAVPGIPSISLTGLYTHYNHDFFELDVYSANLALSFQIPFVNPYLGAGLDRSELNPTDQAFQGASASASRDIRSKSLGHRAEIGINLALIPFTYLNLAAGVANGQTIYHGGLGFEF